MIAQEERDLSARTIARLELRVADLARDLASARADVAAMTRAMARCPGCLGRALAGEPEPVVEGEPEASDAAVES